jgi:Rrf2 family protein
LAQGGISAVYLEKILLRLREKKLVTAKSGPGGGYRLARPASEITAWDIIHAVEDSPQPVVCLGEDAPACETDCEAKGFWARVWGAAVREMKDTTIASLAAAGQEGGALPENSSENPDLAPCR